MNHEFFVWYIKINLTESLGSIEFRLNNVNSICDELTNNEKIRKILGIILACGNHMNASNKARGDADGFDLSIST